MSMPTEQQRNVRIWDAPVRIFHWALAVLVVISWVTSEIGGNAMTYHMWSGYTVLTLLVFRLCWGFFGSEHARFASFVRGPVAVVRYLTGMLRSDGPSYAGHNPLGGWSVILLLLSVLVQAVTGLFANDEIFTEGPLASKVSADLSSQLTTIHRYNVYVLYALIGTHVAAVLFHLFVKKENLVGAMFTGRKRLPAGAATKDARMASNWLALVIAIAAAGTVYGVVNWG